LVITGGDPSDTTNHEVNEKTESGDSGESAHKGTDEGLEDVSSVATNNFLIGTWSLNNFTLSESGVSGGDYVEPHIKSR